MTRIIALFFSLAMCLSLIACGGNASDFYEVESETESIGEVDKSETSNYFGVWESAHMRFTINKGGIGKYEQPGTSGGNYDLTWEVKDEVLVIIINSRVKEYMASFELDEEGNSLLIIQNGLPSYYDGETLFDKQ